MVCFLKYGYKTFVRNSWKFVKKRFQDLNEDDISGYILGSYTEEILSSYDKRLLKFFSPTATHKSTWGASHVHLGSFCSLQRQASTIRMPTYLLLSVLGVSRKSAVYDFRVSTNKQATMNLVWTSNVWNKILLSRCQQAMEQRRYMAELDMWFIVFLVLHLEEEIKTTLAYYSIFDH